MFTMRFAAPGVGRVEVRRGPLPFFLFARSTKEPLIDGMTVRRRFFVASFFELAIEADQDVDMTLL